jgi:pimeloyl-ACP methyl ester carboxylesterase
MVGFLLLVGALLFYSPGKPEPFRDEGGRPIAGSISEKNFVDIGGVKQGMFMRGRNVNNPVLLFVHGGPCFPEYFLFDQYPTGIEDHFTVCYWEQRGGGLSYSPDVPLESMTLEQLVSDTIEVTNHLRDRFDQDKIYLMAHSGGTAFAIQAASEAPELYNAYIGISQITQQSESEKLAYQYLVKQYSASGNSKMLKKLGEFPVMESSSAAFLFFKSLVRDQAMHELGVGTMRTMTSVFKDVFIPAMTCKAYTPREKMNIWVSKASFIRKTTLIDQLFATDLTMEVPELEIPVYFFSGAYDFTVNHDLSKAYLEELQAPVKGFYTFDESAHSPIFEEPAKVREILVEDVLRGVSNLSDRD